MIQLTHHSRILLGVQPADFRRGIDGFQRLCTAALEQDPRDGTLFVFINKARTMIRALVYDQGGFWLMTKRLSSGRFSGWPAAGEPVMPATARQLRVLLGGGHWTAAHAEQDRPVVDQALASASSTTPVRVTV